MAATSLCLLLLVAAPSKGETKLLGQVARVWNDYALHCVRNQDQAEARRAWNEARAADPEFDADGRLKAKIDAVAGEPKSKSDARRKKAHKDAAKLYDKLAKYGDDYRFRAIALEPTKGRIGKVVARVKGEKDVNKAGAMLTRLRAAAPEADITKLEVALAKKDVVLVRGKDHPLVAWLALPDGWKPGKQYPVLVTVDGAGSNFLGAARSSRKRRGKRPWIVLAPCTFANTNALNQKKYPWYDKQLLDSMGGFQPRFEWDVAGLESVLAVVRERFGGEEKIGITGFSGGGNLTYGYTLLFPEKVRFAMPACANFAGLGAANAKQPADGGPPIRIYTGAQDPHRTWTHGKEGGVPGIEPQTDRAVQVLQQKGFTNFTRAMLDGVKHSPLAAKVWETVDELK
ncbi:MAG: hypothetical protein AAGD14_15730 [Planctomycetota bacterium]